MPNIRKPNCSCGICEKEMYRRPFQIKAAKDGILYCSQICFGISCRKEIPCVVCEKPILSSQNKVTCSKLCQTIRDADLQRNHMKGRKLTVSSSITSRLQKAEFIKRRGGVCACCGNDTLKILNVHHIIERCNGGSDEEDNLIVLCPNCHAEVHAKIRTLS